MNFTREPIIETIITPREGCRLVIRSSKTSLHKGSEEEFSVDAVEVVSFGQALFFRSLEKPRPFLVPVGDYEVVEAKESRVVLKNAQYEKTIKIGGGREASFRKEEEQVLPAALEDEVVEEAGPQQDGNRKQRDRHRRRRRRPHEERDEMKQRVEEGVKPETPPSFTNLIPPPTTLISDTIQKYKEQQSQAEAAPKIIEDDSNSISRTALPEAAPLSTSFSSITDWNNFLP